MSYPVTFESHYTPGHHKFPFCMARYWKTQQSIFNPAKNKSKTTMCFVDLLHTTCTPNNKETMVWGKIVCIYVCTWLYKPSSDFQIWKILTAFFSIPYLSPSSDVFLFSCFTSFWVVSSFCTAVTHSLIPGAFFLPEMSMNTFWWLCSYFLVAKVKYFTKFTGMWEQVHSQSEIKLAIIRQNDLVLIL